MTFNQRVRFLVHQELDDVRRLMTDSEPDFSQMMACCEEVKNLLKTLITHVVNNENNRHNNDEKRPSEGDDDDSSTTNSEDEPDDLVGNIIDQLEDRLINKLTDWYFEHIPLPQTQYPVETEKAWLSSMFRAVFDMLSPLDELSTLIDELKDLKRKSLLNGGNREFPPELPAPKQSSMFLAPGSGLIGNDNNDFNKVINDLRSLRSELLSAINDIIIPDYDQKLDDILLAVQSIPDYSEEIQAINESLGGLYHSVDSIALDTQGMKLTLDTLSGNFHDCCTRIQALIRRFS